MFLGLRYKISSEWTSTTYSIGIKFCVCGRVNGFLCFVGYSNGIWFIWTKDILLKRRRMFHYFLRLLPSTRNQHYNRKNFIQLGKVRHNCNTINHLSNSHRCLNVPFSPTFFGHIYRRLYFTQTDEQRWSQIIQNSILLPHKAQNNSNIFNHGWRRIEKKIFLSRLWRTYHFNGTGVKRVTKCMLNVYACSGVKVHSKIFLFCQWMYRRWLRIDFPLLSCIVMCVCQNNIYFVMRFDNLKAANLPIS